MPDLGLRKPGSVTQCAPGGGKTGAREGATQVVLGVGVTTGKVRAGESENVGDLRGGCALRQQVTGDPEIDDAPIGRGKTLANAPTPHAGTVEIRGAGDRQVGAQKMVWSRRARRQVRVQRAGVGSRVQQSVGKGRQTGMGIQDPDPRSVAVESAAGGLLIGEPGEPAEMTPAGAGRIATVSAGQPLAGSGCHGGRERFRTDADPRLQVARASLYDDAGSMSIGVHAFHHRWMGGIEVDENIARVSASSIGAEVDVASLTVAGPKKADGLTVQQLGCCPKPFAWEGTPALGVNQPNQVQFIRHGRQLPRNGLPCKKKTPVVHEGSPPRQPGSVCHDIGSLAENFAANGSVSNHSLSQKARQSIFPVLARLEVIS